MFIIRKILAWAAIPIAMAAAFALAAPYGEDRYVYHELAGIYEPSAVQQLPDGRLLVVEDEAAHALSLLSVKPDRTLKTDEEASKTLMQSLNGKLDDLEALAMDKEGYIYAATSYATLKDGRRLPERERLVRFKIRGNRARDMKDAVNLKAALLKAESVQKAIMNKTGQRVDFNRLNIEGMAYDTKQERLLLGLREPLADKYSIVISINNPKALFEHRAAPVFGEVALLDLAGGGIRSLDYLAASETYLIANETDSQKHQKPRARLWLWDGKPQAAARPFEFSGSDEMKNAEAAGAIQISGQSYLLVMSDVGKAKKKKPSRYVIEDFKP
ncbi:MAG: DUF3616 domain-containing protein [Neisseria sp.]|uniref:DUF3616 domain-containing protein n=1 Tax=Neisseria sp. TaxID=192066 RepID=UPI0026DD64EB|nr:DUF3616 domain-containing protein [Neisseria sp.]MDO4641724.1 DUF3616 domain-containing protein [Neisseria sp.]